jgi:hypothetical protein
MKVLKYASLAGVLGIVAAGQAHAAIMVTGTSDPDVLIEEILGTGITVSNINYIGATNQAGTFTGGLSAGLGFDTGIVLTSGDATLIDDVNDSDSATGVTGTGTNADLNALIPQNTYDQNVLEFDFESAGGDLFFEFAFGSEEYNEYANTAYNDVFAFFLDGVNIALIPGTSTPVSINNVNGGNPLGVGASYPEFYNNNDLNDGGPFYAFEYDGFTDTFTASGLGLGAGTHTIKLAIADAGDSVLDSGVFIKTGSFSDKPPTVPEPGGLALFSIGFAAMGFASRRRSSKA